MQARRPALLKRLVSSWTRVDRESLSAGGRSKYTYGVEAAEC